MGKSVNGIRETFYHDLICDYRQDDKRTASFLYRYFWVENVVGLLEKYFPRVPIERSLLEKCLPKDESQSEKQLMESESRSEKQLPQAEFQIRKQLTEAVKECPEWDRSLLLRAVPGKGRKERRDLWEELWLNDIGYEAGLISDSEYYLWLVEYLAARDIYYKDNSISDGHCWLYRLLFEGLKDTENALAREQLRKNGVNIRTKAQVGRDLEQLAKLIQKDRDIVAGRLHGLKIPGKNRRGERREPDYLPWLTAQLRKMALHIKIKTWLQDSGYPLSEGKSPEETPKESRKQDFSMRLFEAYCNSEEGYDFIRKDMGGSMAVRNWHMDSNGFCIMEPAQIKPLWEALEKNKTEYLYLPLAVDLFSGCIFFLAGKGNYEDVYKGEKEALKEKYKAAKERFCFDYLRLNKKHVEYSSGNAEGMFRLEPAFHENVRRAYQDVLNDFKRYCMIGDNSPRKMIREFNEEKPDGIPDVFRWAFDDLI